MMLLGSVGLTAIDVSLWGATMPTDSSQSVLTLRPSVPGPAIGPQIFPESCLTPPSENPAPESAGGALTTLNFCSGTARGSPPSSPNAVAANPATAIAAAKAVSAITAKRRLGDCRIESSSLLEMTPLLSAGRADAAL